MAPPKDPWDQWHQSFLKFAFQVRSHVIWLCGGSHGCADSGKTPGESWSPLWPPPGATRGVVVRCSPLRGFSPVKRSKNHPSVQRIPSRVALVFQLMSWRGGGKENLTQEVGGPVGGEPSAETPVTIRKICFLPITSLTKSGKFYCGISFPNI